LGAGGFETIFARGVEQCVPAGLVNGRKIHLDGSLVDAHASNDSVCKAPAGQTLTRRQHKKQRQAYEYACAAATCQACPLRPQCTRVQKPAARTIKRHYDQEAIAAELLSNVVDEILGRMHPLSRRANRSGAAARRTSIFSSTQPPKPDWERGWSLGGVPRLASHLASVGG